MKEKLKESFILFNEQKETFDKLTDRQAGKLIKAIFDYQVTKETPKLDKLLEFIFIPIKQTIDRNNEKYEKVCERNKENIRKRWNKEDTKNTSGKSGIQEDTKNTDNDNESEYDDDHDSDSEHDNDSKKVCICHLGKKEKDDFCIECQKRSRCNNPTSEQFKYFHGKKTFEEYDKERTEKLDAMYKQFNSEHKPIKDINIPDYDYLNDKEKE